MYLYINFNFFDTCTYIGIHYILKYILYTLSDYVIDLLNVILNLYAVMLQYVCAIVM